MGFSEKKEGIKWEKDLRRIHMSVKRNSFAYLALVMIVMTLGLSTRYFSVYLPNWLNLYLGDFFWALMIFFLFGFLFKTRETRWIATLAFLFSFGIEISQLYHSQWIDTLRQTRLGGLVLGFGFLWSDLVSYSIGIAVGIFLENLFLLTKKG